MDLIFRFVRMKSEEYSFEVRHPRCVGSNNKGIFVGERDLVPPPTPLQTENNLAHCIASQKVNPYRTNVENRVSS